MERVFVCARSTGSVCSFGESFGRQVLQPVAAQHRLGEQAGGIDARNKAKVTIGTVSYSSAFYCPDVPRLPHRTATHEAFREHIARNHALLEEIVPGDWTPLPRQRGDCGGAAAVKPPHDVLDDDDDDSNAGYGGGGGVAVYPGGVAASAPPAAAVDGVTPEQPYGQQHPAQPRPGFYPTPYGALPSAPASSQPRPRPPPGGSGAAGTYPSPFPTQKPANGAAAPNAFEHPTPARVGMHNALYGGGAQPEVPAGAGAGYPQVSPPDVHTRPPPAQVAWYPQPTAPAFDKYPSPF